MDEVSELRAHLEREQSLRVELEEQVKDYAARLGETFVDSKPKDNTQTTIQYHHNTNTVRYIFILLLMIFVIGKLNFIFHFSVWLVRKLVWR